MANKKFWFGLLVMALVFGTALIGCDNGTNAGFGDDYGFDFDDGGSGGINYTVEADGELNKDTSSKLIFTFDEPVSGLRVENISIIDSSTEGKARKNTRAPGGALSGSGESWTLNITSVTAGKIRVQITKDGIERGRKTVAVFQDNSTGESEDKAIKLTNTLWQDGSLANREQERWYKFEAEAGKEYRVQWDSSDAFIQVTVYRSDLTIIEDYNGVISYEPIPVSGVSGTVYLKVELVFIGYPIGYIAGPFAIRFYDPENMGPLDIITIYEAEADLDSSVVVKWSVWSEEGPIESKGYKVYRSDTKDGTYEEITDIKNPSITMYLDTGLPPGQTYWYKVAGYNAKGEGEWSDPRESGFVADVEAAKPLSIGTITRGELKVSKQQDWYKFTAEAGITYTVQYECTGTNPPSSDYTVYLMNVSALKSDKTPISDFSVGFSSDYSTISGTISGVTGTVYIKVSVMNGDFFGTYGIKVTQ
jgi:hypothetical protein